MAGKPHVMTPKMLDNLKKAFSMGFSDKEACLYCGLSYSTLTDYCTKNKDFREIKELLKNNPKIKAKTVVYESITNTEEQNRKQTIDDSKWFLERKCKDEFWLRTEVTWAEGTPILNILESIQFKDKKDD